MGRKFPFAEFAYPGASQSIDSQTYSRLTARSQSLTHSVLGPCAAPVRVLARSGSTKAFLSEFGASIAPEVKSHGIDVCVLHPSPTASNFYNSKHVTHTIDAMDFFKKTGCTSSSTLFA